MDLEDLLAKLKFPFIGMNVILESISETLSENLDFFRVNVKEKLYNNIKGMITLAIAQIYLIDKIKQEFYIEIENHYKRTK